MTPFSPSFRRFVLALGSAVVPATSWMPGYDERSVARLERYVGLLTRDQALGVVGAIQGLRARLGELRVVDPDAAARRIAVALDRLERRAADRLLVYAAVLPVKVTHYGGPEVYAAMKLALPTPPRTDEGPPERGVIDEIGLRDLQDLELDAIVVGSGAGGAVVAAELAGAGRAVLLVEEGAWFTRRDFGGPAVEMTARMYRNAGLTFTMGNPPIFLPHGRTVGGTTTVNSGTCYRTPDRVLRRWAAEGLPELAPQAMARHFDEVEAVLGVTEAQAPWTGEVAKVIARGAERLGYRHGPLRRNAPECDGQGVCALGCPTDAKRSTNVSYVPLALERGASIAPQTRLVAIDRDGSRAASVTLEHLPSGARVRLRARAIVVATGTLRTPLVLKAAGVKHPWLGRNLSIHPAAAAYAGFDEPTDPLRAIPQGYAIESFHDAGLLYEGGTVAPELAAGALPIRGAALQELMARFDHTANFGFMIEDEGRGRVIGELGDLPIVRYSLSDHDRRRIHHGLEVLAGVFLAAGARWVRPLLTHDVVIRSSEDLRVFSARPLPVGSLQLSAYHPLGTARMSRDPADGVVGPDGRVHGADNLYVADGSVLPGSPAVNPQVTIMAIARVIAERIAERTA